MGSLEHTHAPSSAVPAFVAGNALLDIHRIAHHKDVVAARAAFLASRDPDLYSAFFAALRQTIREHFTPNEARETVLPEPLRNPFISDADVAEALNGTSISVTELNGLFFEVANTSNTRNV